SRSLSWGFGDPCEHRRHEAYRGGPDRGSSRRPRTPACILAPVTSSALHIAVFSGDAVSVHALPPGGRLTVGRAAESDIVIDDPAVSRRHAVIHAGPPLVVEDLGGPNATMLSRAAERGHGGETVALRRLSSERVTLAVGDRLNFGAAVAVVR